VERNSPKKCDSDPNYFVINVQPSLSQVLVKKEADGTKTYYVYGLGLIGQETGGEYLSYHFDYRGSTVALTDETGTVVERFLYSPYGLLLCDDASLTPLLFNGMYGVMTDDNGEQLKELLPQVSSVDVIANDGWTALTVASRNGDIEIVSFLLDNGSEVNASEGSGHSAIF